ncbi:MAG: amidohydrolase family protein [Oxalobacter sp.]|nr:amidohydrolase family protein [Oxalobacter sp.]
MATRTRVSDMTSARTGFLGAAVLPGCIFTRTGILKHWPLMNCVTWWGGATSMVGPDGAPGFVRNFGVDNNEALRESLKSRRVIVDAFPLGDTGCKHQVGNGDKYPTHPDKASVKGAVYIAPVAAGLDRQARNEYLNLSSDKGRRVNMLGRHTGFVHLMALLPQDVKAFAQSGSTSLLGELAVVYAFNEKLPKKAAFSDREIWRMVTANPARLLDVSRQLGDIRTGIVADLALFRKRENISYRLSCGDNGRS